MDYKGVSVSVDNGDTVLMIGQENPSHNGVYVAEEITLEVTDIEVNQQLATLRDWIGTQGLGYQMAFDQMLSPGSLVGDEFNRIIDESHHVKRHLYRLRTPHPYRPKKPKALRGHP